MTVSTTHDVSEEREQKSVESLLLHQRDLKKGHVDTCLYWRIHKYSKEKLSSEFGLYKVDDSTGRIGGAALYYHHQEGATVMVISNGIRDHDIVKITGLPQARASARSAMEQLAENVSLPVIEVSQEERWRYAP